MIGAEDDATAATLIRQVRQRRSFPVEQRLRLVHGGTELSDDQRLPPRPCVVHCTVTAVPRPERPPPPVDWIDAVGPRRLLKWAVGGFLVYANHSCWHGSTGLPAVLLLCVFNAIYILVCFPQLLMVLR